ncbi:MAG TPA: TraB/GumN family protein [Candidatus Lokiarchaeia archaeon]|nr:TraB/GumN family protein [Candidatus Lokiarchaeia archaeon]
MAILERLIILGVVHGQQSCIDETKRVIETEEPEIVAIELPPNFPGSTVGNIDDAIERVSSNYHSFFEALKSLGLPEKYAGKLEDLSIGLALEGFEFLAAVETAKKIGARVEFIDMKRDKIFREFMAETMANFFEKPLEFVPGLTFPKGGIPGLSTISKIVTSVLGEWQEMFNMLTSIYSQKDYKRLLRDIQPFLKRMDENPVFRDVLVDHRNRFMADKLLDLLNTSTGTVILVTGFGHVDGIKQVLSERTGEESE